MATNIEAETGNGIQGAAVGRLNVIQEMNAKAQICLVKKPYQLQQTNLS